MSPDFKVKILGSNAASFAQGRHHTAQAITLDNETYLVDCGEGTQLRMIQHHVRWARLNTIFISHLHGDHCLGLPGLISSMELGGRLAPLTIIGPEGLREWLTTYWRITQAMHSFPITIEEVQAVSSQLVFEDARVKVETIPLDHRIATTGFLFTEKLRSAKLNRQSLPADVKPEELASLGMGLSVYNADGSLKYDVANHTTPFRSSRSFAYCSDTKYSEAIIPVIQDVSLLYHEATYTDAHAEQAGNRYHSTAREAATIAKKANAHQLIIGHFSSRYSSLDDHLYQARQVFRNSQLALEGEVFEVQLPKDDAAATTKLEAALHQD